LANEIVPLPALSSVNDARTLEPCVSEPLAPLAVPLIANTSLYVGSLTLIEKLVIRPFCA
jgi:hypothetical protein